MRFKTLFLIVSISLAGFIFNVSDVWAVPEGGRCDLEQQNFVCDPGLKCAATAGGGTCVGDRDIGAPCAKAAECKTGLVCSRNGFCALGPGGLRDGCDSSHRCASNLTCGSDGFCISLTGDDVDDDPRDSDDFEDVDEEEPGNTGTGGDSGLPHSGGGGTARDKAIKFSDVTTGFKNVFCTLLVASSVLVVGGIIYAGILFITGQGVPAKVDAAKKNLTYVLIGAAVIIGTNVIIATIANAIGAEPITASCNSRN